MAVPKRARPKHGRSTAQGERQRSRRLAGVKLSKHESDEVPLRVVVEVLCAAHLSSYVTSEFEDRGGVILVGPPGALKSACLTVIERAYHDAIGLSDINAQSLNDLKDQIASGTVRTLVIGELAKLYQRDPRTAANVEGTLQALVAEGFKKASFEDARINTLVARCGVLSAITPKFHMDNFKRWEASGFGRRFIWPLLRMKDPHLLERAVEDGQKLRFNVWQVPPIPAEGVIPDTTTNKERRQLRQFLKRQPGAGVHNLQQLLLVKILAVLKWWYARANGRGGHGRKAWRTLAVFLRSLQQGGGELVL